VLAPQSFEAEFRVSRLDSVSESEQEDEQEREEEEEEEEEERQEEEEEEQEEEARPRCDPTDAAAGTLAVIDELVSLDDALELAREAGLPAVGDEALPALRARLRVHYGGAGRPAGDLAALADWTEY
jgi:hypothetical protein